MRLKTLDELRQVAEVRSSLGRDRMSKQERLERWADVLEAAPQCYLRSLYETEYASRRRRYALREDDSPLSVAFQDPVLRAEGLKGDRYRDAIDFFELSDDDLHYLVCYCYHGPTMTPKAVASRVRTAARRKARKSFVQMLISLRSMF